MTSHLRLSVVCLMLAAVSTVRAATSTTALTLTVTRACQAVGDASASGSPLVVKCTRGSAAPQSPLEVVAAPLSDWGLVAQTVSPDGAVLFTYVRSPVRAGLEGGSVVSFY